MIVGITGATGFVGAAVIKRLLSDGYCVRVLSRKSALNFPAHVEVFHGDLSNTESNFDHFVTGCNILIHCAAEIHDSQLMHLVHVSGTKMLLDACERSMVNGNKIHWIQLSSVGVYGPAINRLQNRVITENSTTNPIGVYEITKLESDDLVRKLKLSSFTYTILRPSNIIGKDMTNQSFWQLCFAIKKNLYFHIGNPDSIATYIHIDDVVEAMLKCMLCPAARNQIFNISSDVFMQDLVKKIAEYVGSKNPKIRLPLPFISLFLYLFEGKLKLPISTARVNALTNRTRYPIDKIHSLLEFNLTKPMPLGVTDVISSNINLMKCIEKHKKL